MVLRHRQLRAEYKNHKESSNSTHYCIYEDPSSYLSILKECKVITTFYKRMLIGTIDRSQIQKNSFYIQEKGFFTQKIIRLNNWHSSQIANDISNLESEIGICWCSWSKDKRLGLDVSTALCRGKNNLCGLKPKNKRGVPLNRRNVFSFSFPALLIQSVLALSNIPWPLHDDEEILTIYLIPHTLI